MQAPHHGNERAFALQMHIHGPGSEGRASMRAHDHMAAATGAVDALWWTEHDWRLANFAKISRFSFDDPIEMTPFPARIPEDNLPPVPVPVQWEPDASSSQTPGCGADLTPARTLDGNAALRVTAAPDGTAPATCRRTLTVGNHRACFPLFSRPRIQLAIFPETAPHPESEIFVEFLLSEQPPDLRQALLRYVWNPRLDQPVRDNLTLAMPLQLKPGEWNRIEFDPAADAAGLGLPAAGLDNALHRIRIGVSAGQVPAAACFDALTIKPLLHGNRLLTAQRELAALLPLEVRHFVGMEISWYGNHINAFGSRVPIPDYFALNPSDCSTRRIIEHIHQHHGLACFNHPPVHNPDAIIAELSRDDASQPDLMEIVHKIGANFHQRLQLWDRLGGAGVALTGLGVSDAHSASALWEATADIPCAWVTRIWSSKLEEDALLQSLRSGRVFCADPSRFRGTIDINGPGNLRMGGARLHPGNCSLTAVICGAQPGDTLTWICNGKTVKSETLSSSGGISTLIAKPDGSEIRVVRIELHRALSSPADGAPTPVAVTNPVYLLRSPKALRPCCRQRLDSHL